MSSEARNHILCQSCYASAGGEVKCCSHGCAPGVACVTCGRVRTVDDEYWNCLGGMRPRDVQGEGET